MDNQFVFDSKMKMTFITMMVVGIVCLAWTFVGDSQPGHVRFWSNFLHNSVFFTGTAAMGMFALSAFIVAQAGWFSVIKRIFEAYTLFMGVGIVLMLIVAAGVWGHAHHLYHWMDESALDPNNPAYDKILAGKAPFLNKGVYTFGAIGALAVWYFLARKIRSLSLDEDQNGNDSFTQHKSMRVYSAIFLPIAAFTIPMAVWLWIMSVDAHWYSTMYAWYCMASWFVTFASFTVLTIFFLKGRGYLQNVTQEHLHDMGKYVFAFSVFWTYLWFSQYMLIWYANVGEETIYFAERYEHFPVLFYANLIMNFLIPFFVLMRNDTKRKTGTLILVCTILIFSHWWDFFQMIKPGTLKTAHHDHFPEGFISGFTIPGFLEIGTFVGFLGMFLYFVFWQLSKAPLQPKEDPYMEESLHHHT